MHAHSQLDVHVAENVRLLSNGTFTLQTHFSDTLAFSQSDKKLSYRRGTARCVLSVEIWQLSRNSAETICTSLEQIEVMKLEG